MSTNLERIIPKGYVPGKAALEGAARLINVVQDRSNWISFFTDYAELLAKKIDNSVVFNQANRSFLQALYYNFSYYVHQNRKGASDQDWQKTTAEMQAAIEFAVAHAANGNITSAVLADQLEEPEYRALSLTHICYFLENYRAQNLIPKDFSLPDNKTLLKLTHEQMLELLTKLAKTYRPD